MKKESSFKFYVSVSYLDGTEFGFDVHIEGTECEVVASMMMITRRLLITLSAYKATCYKEDGFELCAYCNR